MNNNLKQFLCGLMTGHSFKDKDTVCEYNDEDKTCMVTETCYRCGKKFSFTAPSKSFGIPD